jgi:hypothetical protein
MSTSAIAKEPPGSWPILMDVLQCRASAANTPLSAMRPCRIRHVAISAHVNGIITEGLLGGLLAGLILHESIIDCHKLAQFGTDTIHIEEIGKNGGQLVGGGRATLTVAKSAAEHGLGHVFQEIETRLRRPRGRAAASAAAARPGCCFCRC